MFWWLSCVCSWTKKTFRIKFQVKGVRKKKQKKRIKNDDHKCLPTIIKLRIFIVNNQSLKLNDKQNKKHSKINLFRDKSNQTKKNNADKTNVAKPNRETREQSWNASGEPRRPPPTSIKCDSCSRERHFSFWLAHPPIWTRQLVGRDPSSTVVLLSITLKLHRNHTLHESTHKHSDTCLLENEVR